jgi:hypothetical protein
MARTYARLLTSIWRDLEWRQLSRAAQWTYLMLLAQPHQTNLGVTQSVPKRVALLAADVSEADVRDALNELHGAGLIYLDAGTDELLVCSFFKNDRVEAQQNLVINAKRQFVEVESLAIKRILASKYPKHFVLEPSEQAENEHVTDRHPNSLPDDRRDDRPDEGVESLEQASDDLPDGRPEGRVTRASLKPYALDLKPTPPPSVESTANGSGSGQADHDREILTVLVERAAVKEMA